MIRNHETLRQVGDALYGPQWQTPLADALCVDLRRMQRWAKGEFNIPAGVWGDISALCRDRGTALSAWAKRLNR